MSYSVSDSINGKAITIAYGAAQLALPRSVAGRARTRVVRQHLASNRAGYALVVRNESDTEVWWAADSAGVSLAAAIESWLDETVDMATGFRVVIPLDTGIYIATVDDGLVSDERILPTDRAEEELRDCTDHGTVVYAYEGGSLQPVVARHVPIEPLPFALFQHAYSPAWKVFGRHAMVHPVHLMAVVGIGAALLVFSASAPHLERHARLGWNLVLDHLPFGQGGDSPIRKVPPTVITPKVDHSGAGQLRTLAIVLANLEGLYRDGLTGLSYSGGFITLRGTSEYPWPETAREYALATASTWSYARSGWSIGQALPVEPDLRHPGIGVEDSIALLLAQTGLVLAAGPESISGPANLLENTITQTIHRTTYQVDYGSTAVGSLLESAAQLDSLPVVLSSANCTFGDWQIQQCQLFLEVRTL